MRLTPWLLTLMLSAPLLVATGSAVAEPEPLDDAALEEKYGIKAGSVQRDDADAQVATRGSTANDDEESEEVESEEVESDGGKPVTAHNGDTDSQQTEGGTGGTGSAEDAIEAGEDEKSNADNDGESEQDINAQQ